MFSRLVMRSRWEFCLLVLVVDIVCAGKQQDQEPEYLLRDAPATDESCCATSTELHMGRQVPAQTMLELSHLTSAQFLDKFDSKHFQQPNAVPDPSVPHPLMSGASIMSIKDDAANIPAVLNTDQALYEPNFQSVRLSAADDEHQETDFTPIEHPIESDSPKTTPVDSSESAFNFRQSRLLDLATTANKDLPVEAPMAENARCQPRDSVVEMPRPTNSSLSIWPQCTIVKRCAGCCGDVNLVCTPTKIKSIQRKGMLLTYVNAKLQYLGPSVVSLSEHEECECQCRQNASDCHANQHYDLANCRCECLNHQLTESCGPNRVWDAALCQCKCPNTNGSCPVGFFFDSSYYCSCISNSSFRSSKPVHKITAQSSRAFHRQDYTRSRGRPGR